MTQSRPTETLQPHQGPSSKQVHYEPYEIYINALHIHKCIPLLSLWVWVSEEDEELCHKGTLFYIFWAGCANMAELGNKTFMALKNYSSYL